MEADLDMDDNDILNAGTINCDDIVVAGDSLGDSVEAAADSAAAALASQTAAASSASSASSSASSASSSASNASTSATNAASSASSASTSAGTATTQASNAASSASSAGTSATNAANSASAASTSATNAANSASAASSSASSASSSASAASASASAASTSASNAATSASNAAASAASIQGFKTLSVSGQSDIVADQTNDTLTISAGSGITITTNAGTDTLTITNSATAPNVFGTIAISGQSDVVADSSTDTLTLVAGTGISLSTNASTDTITITATASAPNVFDTIAVSGQSNVVADQASDTLTLAAGTGMTITTNASTDTITLTVASAPILTTARTIDGQSFDGSGNITVIAPGTHAATGKTTPVDADEVPLVDSAASNVLKKVTWANVKATLKTYFDTLYSSVTAASKSDQTTGTSGTTFVSPLHQQEHDSAAKGWISVTNSGGASTTNSSYSFSVTTRHSTGRFTFTSATAFTVSGGWVATCFYGDSVSDSANNNRTTTISALGSTTTIKINFGAGDGTAIDPALAAHIVIFGRQ